MDKGKFIRVALGVLALGGALIVMATWVMPRVLVYLTQAAPKGDYSVANSYLFGSPLLAEPNGEDKVRVNAFLLDERGRGVADKRIEVQVRPETGGENAQLLEVIPVTDELGKSVWELQSTVAGRFLVSASVDGIIFPQEVTVVFR